MEELDKFRKFLKESDGEKEEYVREPRKPWAYKKEEDLMDTMGDQGYDKHYEERKHLKENEMDGTVQHHIEQIEDDLSYGEFGTIEEVVGFLDAIIGGIERLKIAQMEIFDEEEPDFMDNDFDPND